MTTDYADQRKACADHLYSKGGHYLLVEANYDLFGNIAHGYHEIRALSYDEALTIKLSPLQGLRHIESGQAS